MSLKTNILYTHTISPPLPSIIKFVYSFYFLQYLLLKWSEVKVVRTLVLIEVTYLVLKRSRASGLSSFFFAKCQTQGEFSWLKCGCTNLRSAMPASFVQNFPAWYAVVCLTLIAVLYFLKNYVFRRWFLSSKLPGMKIGLFDFWGDANNFAKDIPEKYYNACKYLNLNLDV